MKSLNDFEKNSTPKAHKEPSFGGANEGISHKKSVSRDITPSTKQRNNAVLDKSPGNNLTFQEKIARRLEDNNKTSGSKLTCEIQASLKNHLDGTRDILFTNNDEILVSVSEDCLIKLWDLNSIENYKENALIDPYLTLRGQFKLMNKIFLTL